MSFRDALGTDLNPGDWIVYFPSDRHGRATLGIFVESKDGKKAKIRKYDDKRYAWSNTSKYVYVGNTRMVMLDNGGGFFVRPLLDIAQADEEMSKW